MGKQGDEKQFENEGKSAKGCEGEQQQDSKGKKTEQGMEDGKNNDKRVDKY